MNKFVSQNINQILSKIVSSLRFHPKLLGLGILTSMGLVLYWKTEKKYIFGYRCYQLPWMSLDRYLGYRWKVPQGHFLPKLFQYRVSTAYANNSVDSADISWAFFHKFVKKDLSGIEPSFDLNKVDTILVERQQFSVASDHLRFNHVITQDLFTQDIKYFSINHDHRIMTNQSDENHNQSDENHTQTKWKQVLSKKK